MNYADFRKAKAIEKVNKERWLKLNPYLTENSGIYILTRIDENGFRYAYIGQAKHILTRLAQHLNGYQHIDLSLKNHKLYNEKTNLYGWFVSFKEFPEQELDEREQEYIKKYANLGYQLRNKTSGSQGVGKVGIDNNKASKGYYDGKKQGYADCKKFIKGLFKENLKAVINGKDGVRKQNALKKFMEFLEDEKEK